MCTEFNCPSRCCWWPCPECQAQEQNAFGYIFENDNVAQTVAVGQNLTFNSNGILQNINHPIGSDSIVVRVPGVYSVDFAIYTANGNPEGWELDVNGQSRGLFTADGKAISAAMLLCLNASDVITIKNVSTVPDPVTLRAGSITAWVKIVKID